MKALPLQWPLLLDSFPTYFSTQKLHSSNSAHNYPPSCLVTQTVITGGKGELAQVSYGNLEPTGDTGLAPLPSSSFFPNPGTTFGVTEWQQRDENTPSPWQSQFLDRGKALQTSKVRGTGSNRVWILPHGFFLSPAFVLKWQLFKMEPLYDIVLQSFSHCLLLTFSQASEALILLPFLSVWFNCTSSPCGKRGEILLGNRSTGKCHQNKLPQYLMVAITPPPLGNIYYLTMLLCHNLWFVFLNLVFSYICAAP